MYKFKMTAQMKAVNILITANVAIKCPIIMNCFYVCFKITIPFS
jgi:hypothetical protein